MSAKDMKEQQNLESCCSFFLLLRQYQIEVHIFNMVASPQNCLEKKRHRSGAFA